MPPKKGLVKRPTDITKDEILTLPAKKPRIDHVDKRCDIVSKAFRQTTGLPEDCRNMISHAVYCSLNLPQDNRDKYQTACVDFMREALIDVERSFVESHESAELSRKELDEFDHEANQRTAEEQLVAQEKELVSKKENVKESQVELKACRAKLGRVEVEMKEVVAEARKVEKEKKVYDDLRANHLDAVKAGTGNGTEHLNALMPTLNNMKLDQAFFAVLPKVVNKRPEVRGSFDNMCMDQLEQAFSTFIGGFQEKLDAIESQRAQVDAETVSCRGQCDKAKEDGDNATAALANAMAEKANRENAVREAKQTMIDFVSVLKKADEKRASAKEALLDFRDGPMVAFASLDLRDSASEKKLG